MSQKTPSFILMDGFKWPVVGFATENFRQTQKLDLGGGDLVINTYPKCGTNWVAYIVWEILHEGKPLPQPDELLMQMMPFVDKFGTASLQSRAGFRALVTHVCPPHCPFVPAAKYVVVVRNPFDCCVSFFHFMSSKMVHIKMEATFEEYFEDFLRGDVPYGDFFDHVLYWYRLRDRDNVKLLIYEKMVADRKRCILEVAEFLGQKTEGATLERIVEHTSFDFMKNALNYNTLNTETADEKKGSEFLRKGIVGDWQTCFSEKQKDLMKNKMIKKLHGTELLSYWLDVLQL